MLSHEVWHRSRKGGGGHIPPPQLLSCVPCHRGGRTQLRSHPYRLLIEKNVHELIIAGNGIAGKFPLKLTGSADTPAQFTPGNGENQGPGQTHSLLARYRQLYWQLDPVLQEMPRPPPIQQQGTHEPAPALRMSNTKGKCSKPMTGADLGNWEGGCTVIYI